VGTSLEQGSLEAKQKLRGELRGELGVRAWSSGAVETDAGPTRE
jgi:hypothetical protein